MVRGAHHALGGSIHHTRGADPLKAPTMRRLRKDLRVYVSSVVNDEWPLLAHGNLSMKTEVALARLFETIGKIQPKDDRDSTIYSEIFSNLNELVSFRRDGLVHSQAGIPILLWTVGLIGSLFVIAYASVFSPTPLNIIMISGISITLGLVFLFILTVDRPFKGRIQRQQPRTIRVVLEVRYARSHGASQRVKAPNAWSTTSNIELEARF